MSIYDFTIIQSPLSKGASELNSLPLYLIVNMCAGVFAGISGGSALVIINSRYFRRKSFGYALKVTCLTFVFIFFFIGIHISSFYAWHSSNSTDNFSVIANKAMDIFTNPMSITSFIFWGFITLSTLFLLQVNDKFGPGILRKFIIGQYYQPREEERIFMFLDIKSSTTIAEKIGHKAYFTLLSDFFMDITQPILNSKGEIYQYVGDEVVISWTLKNGIENANCLYCFYRIQDQINHKSAKYQTKYGLIPKFKAGLHCGNVTAGEIGSIKKDIVFSGDVLNTTARIQEQCNLHNAKLLASTKITHLFKSLNAFSTKPIGTVELRGKQEKIALNEIMLTS